MKKVLFSLAAVLAAAAIFAFWYVSRFSTELESHAVFPQTKRVLASGEVMGFLDNGSYAWLGIPYAEPPIDALRWRAPRPVAAWQVPRGAVEFSDKCPQTNFSGEVEGSEDCLYLNVWSPMEVQTPRPVMLFIHGGGNHIGEGATSIYRGARFAREHDIVLVSINYRLGPLGWLRHPALTQPASPAADSPEVQEQEQAQAQAQAQEQLRLADNSGNFATLDIIEALRWVQTNIGQFGGDADNVTIFGESAGGFNVLSLMVSPLAKELYHKAIVQSGGLTLVAPSEAENYRDAPEPGHRLSSRELTVRLLIAAGQAADRSAAKALQDEMSLQEIGNFLRSQTAEQLLLAQNTNDDVATADGAEEPAAFVLGAGPPRRTPYIFGDGHVLPAGVQLATLFSNTTNYNVTPVILGSNRDETRLFLSFTPGYTDRIFGLPYRISDTDRYQRDAQYGSDLWKADGVDELALRLRASQGGDVYAYRFDWDEFRTLLTLDTSTLLGAAHALELPFVFGNFDLVNKTLVFKDYPARRRLSQAMMSYWAEFAYSGNPAKGRNGDLAHWLPWPDSSGKGSRILLLDSDNDQGIRMGDELVTRATIANDLAQDSRFNAEQRCQLAQRLFKNQDSAVNRFCSKTL